MELLEGDTLEQRMQNGPLPREQSFEWAIEILDGILHRQPSLYGLVPKAPAQLVGIVHEVDQAVRWLDGALATDFLAIRYLKAT